MWKWTAIIIGGLHVLNAGLMWAAPDAWYVRVPGVSATGPFNMHFVRDIALIFLVSGVALIAGALRGSRAALLFGASWPALHALFHIWIWVGRGMPLDPVAFTNSAGIQLPAWLALTAALKLAQKEVFA